MLSRFLVRLKDTLNFLMRNRGPVAIAKIGQRSRISRPWSILGARYIAVGNFTRIHRNAQIHAYRKLGFQEFSPQVTIGDQVYIGHHVVIACINGVTIKDQCVLSDHVYISDSSHGLNPLKGPIMGQAWESRGPIEIGFSTFVGYRAVIMPGVVLGKHCVVGAGAVVTRSFPDYSMVGGSPARLLKVFSLTEQRWCSPT